MVNPLRGEATFEANGETFTLAVNNRAFIAAEAETGWNFPTLLQQLATGNLHALTTLLWAALQKHHGCTVDETDDIVMTAGKAAFDALAKGSEWALPEPSKEPAENPPEATNGTGSTASDDGAEKA